MKSIGTDLKSEREKRQIGLSQIAEATRISSRHLESLEEGRYGDLPGGIYNRAFLKAYCQHLGLDTQAVLERYDSEVSEPSEKPLEPTTTSYQLDSRLSPIATWTVVFLFSATSLFLGRHWISSVFSPYFAGTSKATGRYSPAELVPAPARTPSPSTPRISVKIPEVSTSRQTPMMQTRESNPVQPASAPTLRVELEVTQQCWISIDSDGHRAVEKVLQPGEEQSFVATEHLFIILGNAGGVHLKINGKPARPLGKAGEVVKLLINEDNINNLIVATAG